MAGLATPINDHVCSGKMTSWKLTEVDSDRVSHACVSVVGSSVIVSFLRTWVCDVAT